MDKQKTQAIVAKQCKAREGIYLSSEKVDENNTRNDLDLD